MLHMKVILTLILELEDDDDDYDGTQGPNVDLINVHFCVNLNSISNVKICRERNLT